MEDSRVTYAFIRRCGISAEADQAAKQKVEGGIQSRIDRAGDVHGDSSADGAAQSLVKISRSLAGSLKERCFPPWTRLRLPQGA